MKNIILEVNRKITKKRNMERILKDEYDDIKFKGRKKQKKFEKSDTNEENNKNNVKKNNKTEKILK